MDTCAEEEEEEKGRNSSMAYQPEDRPVPAAGRAGRRLDIPATGIRAKGIMIEERDSEVSRLPVGEADERPVDP
jgi:hypothetical protein